MKHLPTKEEYIVLKAHVNKCKGGCIIDGGKVKNTFTIEDRNMREILRTNGFITTVGCEHNSSSHYIITELGKQAITTYEDLYEDDE